MFRDISDAQSVNLSSQGELPAQEDSKSIEKEDQDQQDPKIKSDQKQTEPILEEKKVEDIA